MLFGVFVFEKKNKRKEERHKIIVCLHLVFSSVFACFLGYFEGRVCP